MGRTTRSARQGIGALSKRTGCNIETIRYYERTGLMPPATRGDGGRYTCAQVKRITVHHLDEVRRKVADLRKIERVLRAMAAQCADGTVPKCPVIDALFDPGAGTAGDRKDEGR